MTLGIVCKCEGLLDVRGDLAHCLRCRKTYPMKDLKTILKLIAVVDYEPSSAAQRPPTEQEKHNALTAAVRKLLKLGCIVMDLAELMEPTPKPAPPPVPQPTRGYAGFAYGYTSNTSTTWGADFPFGNVYVRVTVS